MEWMELRYTNVSMGSWMHPYASLSRSQSAPSMWGILLLDLIRAGTIDMLVDSTLSSTEFHIGSQFLEKHFWNNKKKKSLCHSWAPTCGSDETWETLQTSPMSAVVTGSYMPCQMFPPVTWEEIKEVYASEIPTQTSWYLDRHAVITLTHTLPSDLTSWT